MHATAPRAEEEPAAHGAGAERPDVAHAAPAGQGTHTELLPAAAVVEYVPRGQEVHTEEPAGAQVPT